MLSMVDEIVDKVVSELKSLNKKLDRLIELTEQSAPKTS